MMGEDWLELSDENVSAAQIMRRIRERVAQRTGDPSLGSGEDAESIAGDLWEEMLGEGPVLGKSVPIRQSDCDVVPRHYVIDWRIPILGPIHAVVRRVINAEIRRYLLPSMEKQSRFNRKIRRVIKELIRENTYLRQELEALRAEREAD